MSSLRDTVARAIQAALGEQMNAKPLLGDASTGNWYTDGDVGVVDLTIIADAALAAIREQYAIVERAPTKEMTEAGVVAGDTSYFDNHQAGLCYRAMVAVGEVK